MSGPVATSFPAQKKGISRLLKGSTIFMIAITFGSVLLTLAGFQTALPQADDLSGRPILLRFSSYWELRTFLNKSAASWPYYYDALGARSQTVFLAAEVKGGTDFSTTNIQVEGVDEADIIKCDGEFIYLASNSRVTIVKAYPPEKAQVMAEIKLNGTVVGIFVNRDRLVIFEADFKVFSIQPSGKPSPQQSPTTHIRVYDIRDKKNPVLVRSVSSNGVYFASRMIGDYVYVLVNQPAYVQEGEVVLPILISDGRVRVIPASEIYYANVSDYSYGFTTIVAVNIQNEDAEPTHETFLLGASRGVYASLNNIYLAIPRYDIEARSERTELHRFQIKGSNVKCESSGSVPGRILNQFSMDEYQGYFRIATTTGHVARISGQPTSSNHVYVLNMNLTIVGRLENLAPGESIYSARFMGNRCYLVTFKKVDPLFVVSLEDPADPKVLGKLKIPGYSNYLHPYDETHLIGIGKETVEAEEGDFAWYQGVKISLFDVSDVEYPKETAKYEIGDRGTDSLVLWDHKALLFSKERNLLAIPVLVAEINEAKYPKGVPPFTYGDYVWQGIYVFSIEENEVTLRGRVTHLENSSELLKSGYYFYSDYSAQRALYIEDVLYTISGKKIKMNSLTDLKGLGEVKLP